MAIQSLTYEAPVRRGVSHAPLDYHHLEAAGALAEEGRPLESLLKVFEHLLPGKPQPDLASPLAQTGKQKLGDVFRFLLSAEHEPFSFDLAENTIRLNLTFHMSDVFAKSGGEEMSAGIANFIKTADRLDNILVEKYGCLPAPDTQVTFLKEQGEKRTGA